RPAMHGSNRCAIRTGETWPIARDPAEPKGSMEILFTSIVAAALAMAQRGSPANLEFCTLFSNGSFGAADGCKSRPTVSEMGQERGVAKARCQPGSDFGCSQVR